MRVWSSFVKELKIASRGFYFYVEIGMALVLLAVMIFVIPEHYSPMKDEYVYVNLPQEAQEVFWKEILKEEDENPPQKVMLKIGKNESPALLYQTEETRYYSLASREDMLALVDQEGKAGAEIYLGKAGELRYTYFIQGYESDRMRNILLVLHNKDFGMVEEVFDAQDVRALETGVAVFNDRENTLPVFLTFNGSLMGLFIIAAYVFLDKKEDVIRAYALTPATIWQYMLSKFMVITTSGILTSLILVVPVMGLKVNYPAMLIFLVATGFFTTSLGLLVASFYDDITKSFGTLYLLMMLMVMPAISYYIPGWEPGWVQWIPSYYVLEGFAEILRPGAPWAYVWYIAGGFGVAGAMLFALANVRFKRTLGA